MSKDLFDESTMSFGEHLEVLRGHLWKALIGLAIGVIASLLYCKPIIDIVSEPIDQALIEYGRPEEDSQQTSFWESVESFFGADEQDPDNEQPPTDDPSGTQLTLNVTTIELQRVLHEVEPEKFPAPEDDEPSRLVEITVSTEQPMSPESSSQPLKPITINVQEAFFTYVKVALIAGLVLSSPWVFYQVWVFVAAGLYPHERKWVYRFLPISLGLFLGGAAFCFIFVIPIVLKFLLSFNLWMGLTPQIRMSEWLSFAVTLPLMFGVSFQLPLVMLFLERISVFSANDYREKRRFAIFVIAVLSMLLTPADPTSMLLMMFPLLILYEFGIWLCGVQGKTANPLDAAPA